MSAKLTVTVNRQPLRYTLPEPIIDSGEAILLSLSTKNACQGTLQIWQTAKYMGYEDLPQCMMPEMRFEKTLHLAANQDVTLDLGEVLQTGEFQLNWNCGILGRFMIVD